MARKKHSKQRMVRDGQEPAKLVQFHQQPLVFTTGQLTEEELGTVAQAIEFFRDPANAGKVCKIRFNPGREGLIMAAIKIGLAGRLYVSDVFPNQD